jgi:hypothetical protein
MLSVRVRYTNLTSISGCHPAAPLVVTAIGRLAAVLLKSGVFTSRLTG